MPSEPVEFKTDESFGVVPMRLVDGKREFLLILHNKGHWAFPKGHAEKGETSQQTAQREFKEETGLKIEHFESEPAFVEHYEFEKPNGTAYRKTVTYYLADVKGQVKIQLEEVQDFHWGDSDETRAMITFIESRELFDQVLEHLGERAH